MRGSPGATCYNDASPGDNVAFRWDISPRTLSLTAYCRCQVPQLLLLLLLDICQVPAVHLVLIISSNKLLIFNSGLTAFSLVKICLFASSGTIFSRGNYAIYFLFPSSRTFGTCYFFSAHNSPAPHHSKPVFFIRHLFGIRSLIHVQDKTTAKLLYYKEKIFRHLSSWWKQHHQLTFASSRSIMRQVRQEEQRVLTPLTLAVCTLSSTASPVN